MLYYIVTHLLNVSSKFNIKENVTHFLYTFHPEIIVEIICVNSIYIVFISCSSLLVQPYQKRFSHRLSFLAQYKNRIII